MTHSLHRKPHPQLKGEDFVILCMAAQKFNDRGSGEKLKKIFQMLHELDPDNIADDNLGGIFTGQTPESILEHMGDKAYVSVTFSDEDKLREALKRLKEADLGMSVVVSGRFDMVFRLLTEVGLRSHTVNMSLGIFGNKKILPKEEVLEMTCMCGHGMVSSRHVETVLRKVKARKMTATEGAKDLARSCTCGIFNPHIAAQLIENHTEREQKDDHR